MAVQKVIDLIIESAGAEKELKALNKGLDLLNEKSTSSSKKGLPSIAKGFKAIGTAYKAAGIGLIATAFGILANAVRQNQTVIDAISTRLEFFSVLTGEVAAVLRSVYETVSANSEAFDALGRVMGNLLTIVIAPFKIAFNGIRAAIVGAQLAWEQSFFGGNDPARIMELKQELTDIKDDFVEIGTEVFESGKAIVNDFSEAVTEVADIGTKVVDGLKEINLKAVYETAQANVQLKNSAELLAAQNALTITDLEQQIELQTQIREDENKTFKQRFEANAQVIKATQERNKLLKEEAEREVQLAQIQFNKTKNNEDRIALQEAQNNLKEIENDQELQGIELFKTSIGLLQEQQNLEKSIRQTTEDINILKKQGQLDLIDGDFLRLKKQKEIFEEERDLELQRLTEKRDLFQEGTQAFQDAENERLKFVEQSNNKEAQFDKKLAEAKLKNVQQGIAGAIAIAGANSRFGKALATTQAIIDTFAGANTALKSAPPPLNFINAAAVVAAGIANVKSINATEIPTPPAATGATGGGGGVSIPIAPPAFNIVGAGGVNQLATAIADQTEKPIRAFVVEQDVSSATQLQRQLKNRASL
jgi:hypothetical protein